jgi:hypothetical protein
MIRVASLPLDLKGVSREKVKGHNTNEKQKDADFGAGGER